MKAGEFALDRFELIHRRTGLLEQRLQRPVDFADLVGTFLFGKGRLLGFQLGLLQHAALGCSGPFPDQAEVGVLGAQQRVECHHTEPQLRSLFSLAPAVALHPNAAISNLKLVRSLFAASTRLCQKVSSRPIMF